MVSGQGETLVRFRATDAMGYVSGWTQGTVRIDSVAPSSPVVSGGSLACAASRTISGSDGSDETSGFSGYEHRTSMNGGTTWGAAVAGSSLTLTVTGSYLVQFRSLDVAGNTSAWAPSSAGAANTACIS